MGPSLLPWGTPETTGLGLLLTPSTTVIWVLFVRYDSKKDNAAPVTPLLSSLANMPLCHALSKAAETSRNTPCIFHLLTRPFLFYV